MDLLDDKAKIEANFDWVVYGGRLFIPALTESGTPEREQISDRWSAALLALADDPQLSVIEQFAAFTAMVQIAKIDVLEADELVPMQESARERVTRALSASTDPDEHKTLARFGAGVLRVVDLPEGSEWLIEHSQTDRSEQ